MEVPLTPNPSPRWGEGSRPLYNLFTAFPFKGGNDLFSSLVATLEALLFNQLHYVTIGVTDKESFLKSKALLGKRDHSRRHEGYFSGK